jgi:hypothetical protein
MMNPGEGGLLYQGQFFHRASDILALIVKIGFLEGTPLLPA